VACVIIGVIAHGGSWCSLLSPPSSDNLCVMCAGLALKNIISSLAVIIKESRHRQKGVHNGVFIEPHVISIISDLALKELMALHGLKV
jgi:hypothetical protein